MKILVVDGLRVMREELLLGKNIHIKYVTCGRPDCRCKLGQRHGPYYYVRRRSDDGKYKDVYIKSSGAKFDFDYKVVGQESVILNVRDARDIPDIFQKWSIFVVKQQLHVHI